MLCCYAKHLAKDEAKEIVPGAVDEATLQGNYTDEEKQTRFALHHEAVLLPGTYTSAEAFDHSKRDEGTMAALEQRGARDACPQCQSHHFSEELCLRQDVSELAMSY